MRLFVCRDCAHTQYELFYTPKFCRDCGKANLQSRGFAAYLLATIVVAAVLYWLV